MPEGNANKENEREAFLRGAAAMRAACAAAFDNTASSLREVRQSPLKDGWNIVYDLRLRADIGVQEIAATMVRQMPLPDFKEAKVSEEVGL